MHNTFHIAVSSQCTRTFIHNRHTTLSFLCSLSQCLTGDTLAYAFTPIHTCTPVASMSMVSISLHCTNTLCLSLLLPLSLYFSLTHTLFLCLAVYTLYVCLQCSRNLLCMFTGCFYTHMFTVYIFPGILRQIFLSYTFIG